jgi:hypothetical protein
VKSELKKHLLPLLAIFVIIAAVWFFSKVNYLNFILLFFGLLLGSFFLDLDHLIYWLYLNPNIEESRLAQIAFKKYDFISLLKLLEFTHQKHLSLIFHHFFFQVVMALISIFVFTSSNNPFAMAFLLALNVHLLVDEINDYRLNPVHLQDWLFAREPKQLPRRYLPHYILIFIFLTSVFILLLLKSKL